MTVNRVDLFKLDAFLRQTLLRELAGKSFKVGAVADADPEPDCLLPHSVRAGIAKAHGASTGTFHVPTMSEYEATVHAAAEARFKEASDNPWKRDRWNMTRQIEVQRADPEAAKRMKLAAGVRSA